MNKLLMPNNKRENKIDKMINSIRRPKITIILRETLVNVRIEIHHNHVKHTILNPVLLHIHKLIQIHY